MGSISIILDWVTMVAASKNLIKHNANNIKEKSQHSVTVADEITNRKKQSTYP